MRERPLLFRAAKPLSRHQGRPLARRPIFPAASPSRSTWPAPLDQATGRHLTKPAARPGPPGQSRSTPGRVPPNPAVAGQPGRNLDLLAAKSA